MQKLPHPILTGQRSRAHDAWGSGQYGAPRGGRKHQGLDIRAAPFQKVFAPFPGTITREAAPYRDDHRYRGLVLQGSGAWKDYTLKIFYVQGIVSGEVGAGSQIGYVQNLGLKYPGITNHIHVEVRKGKQLVDPFSIWQMCF
ncbi:MAG: peptidoglycan DD-metalloendopeptidase family protein [Phaeodactylibacter sp.]|nr:peptidoglycan DD-metalloendopeptidase family protein [Phaeodactylibacter sp.]